ncbi:hypothetical protein COO60DRAFT_990593 [Scenedesmus sp. NREL 46B-D3]|nr:hypothetical protein COO60DRAFT_990593 [Scenedesmus sp. NREL 46B-D3]
MLVAHWSSRCPGALRSQHHAQSAHCPVAQRCLSRNLVATAATTQHCVSHGSSSSSSSSRRNRGSHVVQVAKSLLDVMEGLKQQADELQAELGEAGKAAEVAARRSRRLAERSQQLQEYALEHVMLGDESAARAALLQKASVADALAAASRRAEANIALARKLEDVLTEKQLQLLKLIRQAKEQADARASGAATESGGSEQSGRGLKRSRSVAWDSPSMHASSSTLDLDVEQQAGKAGSSLVGASGHGRQDAAAGDNYSSIAHTSGSSSSSSSSSSSTTSMIQ